MVSGDYLRPHSLNGRNATSSITVNQPGALLAQVIDRAEYARETTTVHMTWVAAVVHITRQTRSVVTLVVLAD